MAGCCVTCNQPRTAFGCGCGFTRIESLSNPLVASLTPCVDRLRDLYTCLGARVYEVVLVRTRWSGGERGVGVEEVISEEPILPTPQVGDLNGVAFQTFSFGSEEIGTLRVDQISPRYNEDQLMGRYEGGAPIPADENFYWEIRIPISDHTSGERRRFFPSNVPNKAPLKFQWSINLMRAHDDRTRAGDVRG